MKMRAPALPIINIDPYFSVWAQESPLEHLVHWTGSFNTMVGLVYVDGEEYRFLGKSYYHRNKKVPTMEIESIDADAFSTVIVSKNDKIRLSVKFTSPTLVTDLYYASRPVAYCKVSYEAIDGAQHSVKVKFSCTEEFVLNKEGEGRAYSRNVPVDGMTVIKMGNGEQNILHTSGDDIRIDWGFFYLGVVGEGYADNEAYDEMYAVFCEKEIDGEALFVFAYDDIESIVYFNDHLKAYWKKDGKTIEEAIAEAVEEYDELVKKCTEFSDRIKIEALEKGGEDYAELLLLAYRQVMAAHKLVVDNDGNNLYISKECFSNGCAATVDVTYPSAPMYLLYNPELLKGMLRPVFHYAATPEWEYDFAPHDVGQYPILNGQVYAENRLEYQMPVEECGNMIILCAAICDAENDVSFAKEHIDTLRQWSEYLIRYGLDPEHQLCTDDFAGHLAHNVNLSIKAIMGIAGYSRILDRLGEKDEADRMMNIAKNYARSLVKNAENDDGSFRLAYDKPGTFSLKYNSVWDKIWKTELFPKEFYQGEIERYKKEMLTFGVPLDSREKYTKSDWLVWAACLSESKENFEYLVHPLWNAYNTMRTRVPMTDWYFCDTSHMRGFQHRTVQGGLFIKFMLK